MASRWMRELNLVQSVTNQGVFSASKFICYFIRYVLGYTWVGESVTGSGNYNTHEKSGTDGEMVSTSFRFKDIASSSFEASDVDKWILIIDTTNPLNCGWYRITNYVDADNIDIDFKSGGAEYPVAATLLSWYIIGETYDVPTDRYDYWRLRTPHADGWEVEVSIDYHGTFDDSISLKMRVSLDQDWTSSGKIIGPVWAGAGAFLRSSTNSEEGYWYVEGESDGTYLNILCYDINASHNALASICHVTPWETVPAHSTAEKWALLGPDAPSTSIIVRWPASFNKSWGTVHQWRDAQWKQIIGYLLDWGRYRGQESFTHLATRTINVRRNANDVLTGSHAVLDPDNEEHAYELIGRLAGHDSIRDNMGKMQTIDHAGGTKNRVHVGAGILLPWPGVTPQFTIP